MNVSLSLTARSELLEIWLWNLKHRGLKSADLYSEFLNKSIRNLADLHQLSKVITSRPKLRYVNLHKKSGGYGHILVFRIQESQIEVVHIFHSAQNWEVTLLAEES